MNNRYDRWQHTPQERFENFGEDEQAKIKQAVKQAAETKYAEHRYRELAAYTRAKPPFPKRWARVIVIAIGCFSFSASSGQAARQTLGGALVIPASIIGGIFGGVMSHEMGTIVFSALLLKNSTDQARRSLKKSAAGKKSS